MLALVLFLANVYVVRGLFSVEYLRHMGSIEGAYIGLARYIVKHFPDLSWFALWYNGVPYQNTYPPLLHWVVALVAGARGITPAHAYHWTIAVIYCLGPVTVFLLVRGLSGSRWAGFAAGWMYTALSPSAWLISKIVTDLGSPLRPRRLQALLLYGEGPHVSAMTLLPVALLLLHLAVVKKKAPFVLAAALALAGVVLTNWLAGFALTLGVAAYLLAGISKGRDLLWVAMIGVAAYALAMPWAPPSTIAVTQFNAKTIGGDYTLLYQSLPKWGAVVLAGWAAMKFAMRRLPMGLQFAVYFSYPLALVTLADGWYHVAILPQPDRYHLEMEMALVMTAAVAGYEVLKRSPKVAGGLAMVALAVMLIQPLRICRRYARTFLITTVDIEKTSEWKTADWLNKNWSGERVMMPGSTSFWLTAFSDVPELGGGYAQGITDYQIRVASYGLTAGVGEHWAEWSVLWLKALGVQAVGVSGPGSTEVYRDFVDVRKFDGVLDVLWRDGGDVLYAVEKRRRSLARVVPRMSLVARTPINGADVDPLRGYVEALEDSSMPEARFTWTSGHAARVETELREGDVVSWQEAWHPGWRAFVKGREVPVWKDALGMMVIAPKVAGPVAIELRYDGGMERRVAWWACGLTTLGLVGWAFLELRRPRYGDSLSVEKTL